MPRTALATTFAALVALGLAAPPLAAQEAVTSTVLGNDRAGPWGASSFDFSTKVSKSIFLTVNAQRERKGLSPLSPDPALGLVAGAYAGDMISGDFFGHFAPDGRDLQDRLEEVGAMDYAEVAENLWTAEGADIQWFYEESVRRAVLDWMNSEEGHREAILDPNLALAGVGTAIRDERIVVAMLFGRK